MAVHVDGALVLAAAVVGVMVGLTGAGGGALMTPMLVFLFGVPAPAAVSSDLVAAMFMRPVGGLVHWRRGTVTVALVGWLSVGSVPAALAGAAALRVLGAGRSAATAVEVALGVVLLLGAGATVVRAGLARRRAGAGFPGVAPGRLDGCREVRRARTVAIGVVGGLMVGLTSVGSGSLMMVLLMLAYPALGASELVGTDLVQAVPLTAAAALGQVVFGHVEAGVTLAVVLGSVPGVVAGSLLSSRAPDRLLRPVLLVVLVLAGLRCVGVGPVALGGVAAAAAVGGAGAWALRLVLRAPRRAGATTS